MCKSIPQTQDLGTTTTRESVVVRTIIFWNLKGSSTLYYLDNETISSIKAASDRYMFHQSFVIGDFNAHIGQLNQLNEQLKYITPELRFTDQQTVQQENWFVKYIH